jgi:hypothetical protein
MTAIAIGIAAFTSAQLIGQARLSQESSASHVAERAEQQRLRLEYIRVAVAILTAKPIESQREMRRWAVDVLNNSADVKLSAQQSQELIDGFSVLYGTDYGYGNGYGTDYRYGPQLQVSPTPSRTP